MDGSTICFNLFQINGIIAKRLYFSRFPADPHPDHCCPATALRHWLNATKIAEGAIFRRITRWGQVGLEPLHAGAVNAILRSRAQETELSYVPELSSHSFRRGLATSAHRAGADFLDIKRQGGWRHDGTVQGYIEEAEQFTANAAGKLLTRGH